MEWLSAGGFSFSFFFWEGYKKGHMTVYIYIYLFHYLYMLMFIYIFNIYIYIHTWKAFSWGGVLKVVCWVLLFLNSKTL